MGIKFFAVILLTLALFSLQDVTRKEIKLPNYEDIPIVTFLNAQIHAISQTRVNQMAMAQSITRYETRDVMLNGTITNRVKNGKNNEKEVLSAKEIIKEGEVYSFLKDVKYDREDLYSLRTQELFYDAKNEIAYNTLPFQASYKGSILKGKAFKIDNKKRTLKAQNTKFEINKKDTKKGNS